MTKLSKVLMVVLLTAALMGCSLPTPGNMENTSTGEDSEKTVIVDDGNENVDVPAGNEELSEEGFVENAELKELEFKYWDVDNNNGIPYFFAKVYNPNDVTVDFGAYTDYSAGSDKSVAEENDIFFGTIGPRETIVVSDLSGRAFPDTDSIDIRYDFISQSLYAPVDTDFTVSENTEDEYGHHIDVTIAEEDFFYCDVIVLYYLDGNVSGFDFVEFYPGDDYSYDTGCVFDYDDFEVFVSAYKYV